MAKYTVTVNDLVTGGYNIFNFDYPLPPEHKPVFEENFLNYYRFYEIGFETPEMFRHYLKTRLNLICDRYTKLYETTLHDVDYVNNYDMTEENKAQEKTSSSGVSDANTTGQATRLDTPQGSVSGIDDYATEVNKDTSNNTATSSANANGESSYILTRKGNIGVMTVSDMIQKYRDILIDLDDEIIKECKDLFMLVW